MFAGYCSNDFIRRQRVSIQLRDNSLETRIERSDSADGSPVAKILQHGPHHAKRFRGKPARKIALGAASSGEEFKYKNS